MFSAARKGRKARRKNEGNKNNHLTEGLLAHCKSGFQTASDVLCCMRRELHRGLAYYDSPEVPLLLDGTSPPALLLASVSSSTGPEPRATLPSKDRAIRPAKGSEKATPSEPGDATLQSSSTTGLAAPSSPLDGDGEGQERILISEIDVAGADGDLRAAVLAALTTRPNFAYTVKEVQDDVQRVFDTGFFSSCRPRAEDTRDGVRLTIEVTPNPELRGVVARGTARLPQAVVEDAFLGMRGRTLNFNNLTAAVSKLNSWYEQHGVLGQVIDVEMGANDIAEIRAAEATVNRISLRFLDPKSGEVREDGRTRPDIIMRQLTTRPGQVYNLQQAKQDIEAVYSMGLFEDVSIRPQPAEGSTVEMPRVDLTLEVKERKKTGGLAAGGGISAASTSEGSLPGFVGTVSYSQRNLFGLGQRLVASAEVGQVNSTFRVTHTDPWVRGDAFRTSRTISAQNTKTSAAPVHGRALDDDEIGSGSADSPGYVRGSAVSSDDVNLYV